MIYIEASPHLRLRPSHLLLLLYRYLSGVYQVGDLSALNYIKGFLNGTAARRTLAQVLTVSGHGIGEAEMWLAERVPDCEIETVSFRLIDTQLLQFLRSAEAADIETVFAKFTKIVAPYPVLSELVAAPGLVPYWCEQSKAIRRLSQRKKLVAFSDSPLEIPASKYYDLIYASHGVPFLTLEAVDRLRRRLSPGGLVAVLLPAPEDRSGPGTSAVGRFANSAPVQEAKEMFRKLLEKRGYVLAAESASGLDLSGVAARHEVIHFGVLAPADSVLLGELILSSLYEHISDRARLEVLNETAAQFKGLQMSVNEKLDLYILDSAS